MCRRAHHRLTFNSSVRTMILKTRFYPAGVPRSGRNTIFPCLRRRIFGFSNFNRPAKRPRHGLGDLIFTGQKYPGYTTTRLGILFLRNNGCVLKDRPLTNRQQQVRPGPRNVTPHPGSLDVTRPIRLLGFVRSRRVNMIIRRRNVMTVIVNGGTVSRRGAKQLNVRHCPWLHCLYKRLELNPHRPILRVGLNSVFITAKLGRSVGHTLTNINTTENSMIRPLCAVSLSL